MHSMAKTAVPYSRWLRCHLLGSSKSFSPVTYALMRSHQMSTSLMLLKIKPRLSRTHLERGVSLLVNHRTKYLPAISVDLLNRRHFHGNGRALYEKESSKVEQTVNALKEAAQKKQEKADKELVEEKKLGTVPVPIVTPGKAVEPAVRPPTQVVVEPPKRSIRKRVWDTIVHTYHGFRLLIIDIRVSTGFVWKILNGNSLSRREHRQFIRTVADLFRLVPFSVFIIVPFAEVLLPVALKLFPGMLPSTFQTASDKESKIKSQLKVKLEMTKFLQNTLDQMGLQAKGDTHSHAAKEFADFFVKIRKSGEGASNEDILKFSKLFEDEITLDSLSRPQLIALCRLLELKPLGTNNLLRFGLRMKLRSLNADDQMIHKEGIGSLTVPELQQACRARGMRALGVPEDRLRTQLSQWLELSLNEHIPPSLLLLSRVLYLPENIPATDQLKATIQTLSLEAATEAKYRIGETEGKIDNKTKIELIKIEERAIKKEKEEMEAEKKLEQVKEKVQELMDDKAPIIRDKATQLGEMVAAKEKKKEDLSKEDIDSLENALEQVAEVKRNMLLEKEELQDIKEEMADYKEDIDEFKELTTLTGQKELKETKAAKNLRRKVNKMVTKMDTVLGGLESKKETLQKKIDSMVKAGVQPESEKDNIININELLTAIRKLQKVGDDTKIQRIVDVLDMMDVDHDGHVELEHVVKVLELVGRENVKVSSEQMKDIINLLIQEEKLEDEAKKLKEETKSKEMTGRQVHNSPGPK